MRKITREAVEAFMNYRNYSSGNTQVFGNGDTFYMSLFGNTIAKNENGRFSITLAGWNSNTTRERLNGLPGVRVTTKKGQAHLNGEEWDGTWRVV